MFSNKKSGAENFQNLQKRRSQLFYTKNFENQTFFRFTGNSSFFELFFSFLRTAPTWAAKVPNLRSCFWRHIPDACAIDHHQFWNLGVVFNLFVCIESTFLQYLESNYSPSELQNQIIWNISDKSRLLGSTKNNLALHATNLSQLLHTFSRLSKVFSKIWSEGTEISMRSRYPLIRFSLNWMWREKKCAEVG